MHAHWTAKQTPRREYITYQIGINDGKRFTNRTYFNISSWHPRNLKSCINTIVTLHTLGNIRIDTKCWETFWKSKHKVWKETFRSLKLFKCYILEVSLWALIMGIVKGHRLTNLHTSLSIKEVSLAISYVTQRRCRDVNGGLETSG